MDQQGNSAEGSGGGSENYNNLEVAMHNYVNGDSPQGHFDGAGTASNGDTGSSKARRDHTMSPTQTRELRRIEASGAKITRRTFCDDGTLKVSCTRGRCKTFEMIGRRGGRQTVLCNSDDLRDPVVIASLISNLAEGQGNE
jgi:hypothetical protein